MNSRAHAVGVEVARSAVPVEVAIMLGETVCVAVLMTVVAVSVGGCGVAMRVGVPVACGLTLGIAVTVDVREGGVDAGVAVGVPEGAGVFVLPVVLVGSGVVLCVGVPDSGVLLG